MKRYSIETDPPVRIRSPQYLKYSKLGYQANLLILIALWFISPFLPESFIDPKFWVFFGPPFLSIFLWAYIEATFVPSPYNYITFHQKDV